MHVTFTPGMLLGSPAFIAIARTLASVPVIHTHVIMHTHEMNNTAITVGNKDSKEEASLGVQAMAFAVDPPSLVTRHGYARTLHKLV